ncbi:MAG: SRPBCC family protein [Acidimicrobiales bacterium]
MELTADLEATCPPEELFGWVDDLTRYTRWLGLVHRVEPNGSSADPEPSWTVDLRASVGPFARTKRLRMVRTAHETPRRVRFERREVDGREHGAWELLAEVDDTPFGSRLTMTLRYDGRFWGPALGAILSEEIERSRVRLAGLVET